LVVCLARLVHEPGESPVIVIGTVLRGLFGPVYVTHAGDGSGRLFVVERGVILIARDDELLPEPFLNAVRPCPTGRPSPSPTGHNRSSSGPSSAAS
jgi:hypothetical protein